MNLAGPGIVIGIAGAALVTLAIKTILYNVTPTDPLRFVGVAIFLMAVSAIAAIPPHGARWPSTRSGAIRND